MKIIIPIMAETPAGAVAQAEALAANPQADWVELRLDPLPGGQPEVLRAVRRAVGAKTLLVTVRTKREGGLADLTPAAYAALCRSLLATGAVDILDIEQSVGPYADVLIDEARAAGALALCSRHHFEGTPPLDEMVAELTAMRRADIAKLAVMPRTPADAALLLQATAQAQARMPDTSLITMSMGRLGAVTRVCGGAFGSMATFGTAGVSSAPGQPSAAALRAALDALDAALGAADGGGQNGRS